MNGKDRMMFQFPSTQHQAMISYRDCRYGMTSVTIYSSDMEIANTDYKEIMSLMAKAIDIIRKKDPTTREYNVARRMFIISKKLKRNEERRKHGEPRPSVRRDARRQMGMHNEDADNIGDHRGIQR